MSLRAKNTSADQLRRLLKTNKVRHAGAILRGGASGPPERIGIGVTLTNGAHLRVAEKTFTDVIGPIVETPLEHELKDEAPIFVHGPRACGKSRNARWIAETFGRTIDDVVDDWQPGAPIAGGNVYLCVEPPRQEDAPRAIIVPFQRLGQATNIPVPPQSPFTCCTSHVRAQAVLRLLGCPRPLAARVDSDLIDNVAALVSEAGIEFALSIINAPVDEDVPF